MGRGKGYNNKAGHKFKPGVYEPAANYPQIRRADGGIVWVKAEECPCGCRRFICNKDEQPRARGGVIMTIYYIGSVQQPKIPICLLE